MVELFHKVIDEMNGGLDAIRCIHEFKTARGGPKGSSTLLKESW
jgi:hypothetical protein